MLYEFKQSLRFVVGKEKEVLSFSCGNHEVPEKLEQEPFFLKCVKAGLILDGKKPKPVALKSDEERAKILINKLEKKAETLKEEDKEIPKESEGAKGKKSR